MGEIVFAAFLFLFAEEGIDRQVWFGSVVET